MEPSDRHHRENNWRKKRRILRNRTNVDLLIEEVLVYVNEVPSISEADACQIETRSPVVKRACLWKRYVDDLFTVFDVTELRSLALAPPKYAAIVEGDRLVRAEERKSGPELVRRIAEIAASISRWGRRGSWQWHGVKVFADLRRFPGWTSKRDTLAGSRGPGGRSRRDRLGWLGRGWTPNADCPSAAGAKIGTHKSSSITWPAGYATK